MQTQAVLVRKGWLHPRLDRSENWRLGKNKKAGVGSVVGHDPAPTTGLGTAGRLSQRLMFGERMSSWRGRTGRRAKNREVCRRLGGGEGWRGAADTGTTAKPAEAQLAAASLPVALRPVGRLKFGFRSERHLLVHTLPSGGKECSLSGPSRDYKPNQPWDKAFLGTFPGNFFALPVSKCLVDFED